MLESLVQIVIAMLMTPSAVKLVYLAMESGRCHVLISRHLRQDNLALSNLITSPYYCMLSASQPVYGH